VPVSDIICPNQKSLKFLYVNAEKGLIDFIPILYHMLITGFIKEREETRKILSLSSLPAGRQVYFLLSPLNMV
jgi:hypothetical protein